MTSLTVSPVATASTPEGVQTFTPESSRDITVTFTNTTGGPAAGVSLSIAVPSNQWTSVVSGTTETSKTFAQQVAPGASVSATFKVTSGPVTSDGDLVGNASWTNPTSGRKQVETAVEKVRNARPVKINEFRVTSGAPGNATNSFIELYNAGSQSVDISNWTLTEHPVDQAIFSTVKIPGGTKLAASGFYLLGLSNSGLAAPARPGDSILHVRNTDGMSIGNTITIGTGSSIETRKIGSLGTAATNHTTLWQPLPEGPVITIPAGSTNVPVESASGFVVGQKIALGYGSTYPIAANTVEQYEIATVTAVGKPGFRPGQTILIDSGANLETAVISTVGTAGATTLSTSSGVGATVLHTANVTGFSKGQKILIDDGANSEKAVVSSIRARGGATITLAAPLARAHASGGQISGSGISLTTPLTRTHSSGAQVSDNVPTPGAPNQYHGTNH